MKTTERSTRERLIEAAVKRFYRDGFRNVGIDQIYGDVGISKTAFYKHFESKDDLMLAVLNDQRLQFEEMLMAQIQQHGGDNAVSQLRSLFDLVEQVIERDEWHGCIFVNATMEFPLPHDPAHQAAARAKRAFEAVVRDIAARGGAADPDAFARELCLIIEGAYVSRHVTGDQNTIHVARRLGEMVIALHIPTAATP
jgi:AcrR family transcriptional regulator